MMYRYIAKAFPVSCDIICALFASFDYVNLMIIIIIVIDNQIACDSMVYHGDTYF